MIVSFLLFYLFSSSSSSSSSSASASASASSSSSSSSSSPPSSSSSSSSSPPPQLLASLNNARDVTFSAGMANIPFIPVAIHFGVYGFVLLLFVVVLRWFILVFVLFFFFFRFSLSYSSDLPSRAVLSMQACVRAQMARAYRDKLDRELNLKRKVAERRKQIEAAGLLQSYVRQYNALLTVWRRKLVVLLRCIYYCYYCLFVYFF
jgi:hypothetical protein